MLTNLHIRNIGIIEDLSINLNSGFNVLSGETGAGKTLIIDSLGIISGGRFSKDMIRSGENYSFVEVCFYLPNNDISKEDNVIISREIYANGRNLCKINGRMVTVNELKSFMYNILDIHGQHENQSILDVDKHIKYLDDFIGEDLINLKKKYQTQFTRYNDIKLELKRNYGDEKEKQRRLDLLKYELNEIKQAKLKLKEDQDLEQKRKVLLNYEKITENIDKANVEINENTIDSINIAIKSIEKIEELDDKYSVILNNLKNSYYDLQELGRDIINLKGEDNFDKEYIKQVEERLDLIYLLKKKYGNNIEEIMEYSENLNKEIYEIENLEQYNNKLKQDLQILENEMQIICMRMNQIRNKYSKILKDKINYELEGLEMKNAKFNIKIEKEDIFNINGKDKVEFVIKTNVGEQEGALIKIASGGEMSRIMLSIKTVLADVDKVSVLVFDEIDTGVSGTTAKAIADKIKNISKSHQVLCVTHLATIAAKADYNYYISKNVQSGKTKTKIKLLNDDEIVYEIARMASGSTTNIALKHAMELRKN